MCRILSRLSNRNYSGFICYNLRHYCINSPYACSPIPLPRYIDRSKTVPYLSGSQLRQEFIDYFKKKHNHTFIPGTSLLSKSNDGTYFTNAGMNQFKTIFLSTSDNTSVKRAVNSQRCARIGGKHNDLSDVGYDSFHHTYFEMLGNWSFGDYGKEDACTMMWQFLTRVLKLPTENLYVTYFEGCKELGLPPDNETRDIWLKLGVSDQRILRGNMKDNFWEMGEVGPCGPATEIHFDHVGGGRCARCFVNSGSPEVIELWNAVFIQYNRMNGRHEADSFQPLMSQRLFVDTGMGLERLAAVVQGVTSNFDTDLILPIIDRLSSLSPMPPYSGTLQPDAFKEAKIEHLERFSPVDSIFKHSPADNKMDKLQIGRDVSYRIVADHLRFVCATIADGLLPGRKENEKRLRHIVHRLMYHSHVKLGIPPGKIHQEIDFVLQTMGIEKTDLASIIPMVLATEEEKFLPLIENILMIFNVHTKNLLPGDALSEYAVIALTQAKNSKFAVNFDLLSALCRDYGFASPSLPQYMVAQEAKNQAKLLQRLEHRQRTKEILQSNASSPTDDSFKYKYYRQLDASYDFSFPECEVKIILVNNQQKTSIPPNTSASILLDKTSFYAESGGQLSDSGYLMDRLQGQPVFRVDNVEEFSGNVLHHGQSLGVGIKVNDSLVAKIDTERRMGLMQHHTAHHLFLHCLADILADNMRSGHSVKDSLTNFHLVSQRGSRVSHDKFFIQVTSLQTLDNDLLMNVEQKCREYIDRKLPIYTTVQKFDDVKNNPGVRYLSNENYPDLVNLISIGRELSSSSLGSSIDWPVEVCAGTHVQNTGDLMDIVVVSLEGAKQPVKEISCITGEAAKRARLFADELSGRVDELEQIINDTVYYKTQVDQLFEQIKKMLPKVEHKLSRDSLTIRVSELKREFALRYSNWHTLHLMDRLKNILDGAMNDRYLCAPFDVTSPKRLMNCVVDSKPTFPLLLWDPQFLLCHIPEECPGTDIVFHDKLVEILVDEYNFPVKTSSAVYTPNTTLFFLLRPSHHESTFRNLISKQSATDDEINDVLSKIFGRIVKESHQELNDDKL